MGSAVRASMDSRLRPVRSLCVHRVGDAYLCVGATPRLAMHTAHAFTIVVALEEEILVRFGGDPRWQSCAAAVIAPDVPHELDGRGDALTLFVGPETADGRRFARRTMMFDSVDLAPSLRQPEGIVRALVDQYATARAPRPVDPRIRNVLRLIRAASRGRVTAPELACEVALSPSRLVHLFQAETQTTIKRCSLWFRLLAALQMMSRCTSIAQLAYGVGFSDPAHLSRTFRTMLGITPSEALRLMQAGRGNSIYVLDDDRSVPFRAGVRP
jgi:AraC family transcriptional regulator